MGYIHMTTVHTTAPVPHMMQKHLPYRGSARVQSTADLTVRRVPDLWGSERHYEDQPKNEFRGECTSPRDIPWEGDMGYKAWRLGYDASPREGRAERTQGKSPSLTWNLPRCATAPTQRQDTTPRAQLGVIPTHSPILPKSKSVASLRSEHPLRQGTIDG